MMKKKIVVGALAFTLLAGTGTGVYAYNHNQKVLAAEAAELEQLRVETIENAEKAVDSLYNSAKTMLADDLETKIQNAEKAVDKIDANDLKTQLKQEISEVKQIANIQQEVYSTLENGVLVKNVTKDQLEEIAQKLIVIKSKNEAIFTHLTEYLTEADNQLSAIDKALAKVKEAEKSLSRNTYNSALTLVDEVKNEVRKDELKKQLDTVNEKIVAIEEEAKRKKEEEAKIAAEKAEAEKAAAAEQSKQQNSVASSSSQAPSSQVTNSNKSNTQSSTSSNKATSQTNQSNSGSKSVSSNSSSTNKSSSTQQKPASKPSGSTGNSSSGGNDWDKIGEQLENHDWSKTGSGEIDKDGNTWETWE
ncbi:hypothetical protein [Heyndrickxia sporothermodurans]|uniref:hypothetical protein n=1 Tax=Heyndrickxia sporothermodurans TaxID=46224 RepID=UPI000D3B05BD|nr:hypothetical protein [Heyndrickxia sporothermodurans]PTY92330.1 hypothetical protein B5V90_03480 [Heyndrickxia sporothermodurans]